MWREVPVSRSCAPPLIQSISNMSELETGNSGYDREQGQEAAIAEPRIPNPRSAPQDRRVFRGHNGCPNLMSRWFFHSPRPACSPVRQPGAKVREGLGSNNGTAGLKCPVSPANPVASMGFGWLLLRAASRAPVPRDRGQVRGPGISKKCGPAARESSAKRKASL